MAEFRVGVDPLSKSGRNDQWVEINGHRFDSTEYEISAIERDPNGAMIGDDTGSVVLVVRFNCSGYEAVDYRSPPEEVRHTKDGAPIIVGTGG